MTDSSIQAQAPSEPQQPLAKSALEENGLEVTHGSAAAAMPARPGSPASATSTEPTEIPSLPPSAQRVAALLARFAHPHPVVMLPQTGRTSAEAAQALGCEVANIAKSIIFRRLEDDRPVLVVASGINRVDERKVTAQVGAIGRADARFVRDATGYAIGGVCPIGHAIEPVVLIDADLMALDTIWAAAGHPHAVFQLDGATLARWTNAPVIDLAERR